MRVTVLRIGSQIAMSTFTIFPAGVRSWAEKSGLTRLDYSSIPLERNSSQARILTALELLIKRIKHKPSDGLLVVGVPGPIDCNGRVLFSPFLPVLADNGFLAEFLVKLWPRERTLLANNTNLCALAELEQGAARELISFMLVNIGSGLGSAFCFDGKSIFLGDDGLAGEIGHTVVNSNGPICQCGQKGCLERYASGDALEGLAKERGFKIERASQLRNMEEARGLVKEARSFLVFELFNALRPLNLRHLLLGGMLADLFDPNLIEMQINQLLSPFYKNIWVRKAHFSAQEGTLIGGGHLGFELLFAFDKTLEIPQPLVLKSRSKD